MKAIIHLSTANFFKIVLVLCISAAGAACNHNGPKPGPAPKAPEPGEPQPAPPPPPVPPQYTRPGSAGTAVPARRVMVQTDYGTQFALPDTLTCTDKYGLRTEAELEPVNCTTPPYSTLFDEAEFALRNRLSQVSCPDACPDKAVQITRLQGECAAQRNKAWVIVTTQLSCQAANAPALPTLQLPDPLPARFDNRLPGVTAPSPLRESCATHVEIHYDANGEEIAELCPTSWVVAGTSKAPVTSCDAVTDYRPYIERAREAATNLWRRSACRGQCRKQPPRELRSEWACKEQIPTTVNDEVETKVFIEVSCRAP